MSSTKTAPSPVMAKSKTTTAQTPVKTQTQENIPEPVTAKPATPKTNTSGKLVYHTVQKGDSLWSIAGRYKGVTVEEIRRLNNLSTKTVIYPGQKLKISLKG
jgi:membrane-bound lytic murein transglycosylase D